MRRRSRPSGTGRRSGERRRRGRARCSRTWRRSDRTPDLTQNSTEAALTGPQLTLFRSDGHLRSMEELEADIIRLAIGHYRGRMTEVARRLGIGRSTLYRKLGELGIDTAA